MKIETKYVLASDILYDIWMNIDWDKVDKKRSRSIWDEYEGQVRALAKCNSNLHKFITSLCNRMDSSLSRFSFDSLQELEERETLNIYRNETQIVILLVKLKREDEKLTYDETNILN